LHSKAAFPTPRTRRLHVMVELPACPSKWRSSPGGAALSPQGTRA
jgi:hypothetical protein